MSFKTQEEMAKEIDAYCASRSGLYEQCSGCAVESMCGLCYGQFEHPEHLGECLKAYDALELSKAIPVTTEDSVEMVTGVTEVTHDSVNHPKHYCREGAMECIDEMVLIFGKEVVKHFCICNAWKYRARAMDKNGEEDLKKSDWYIKKFKELNDGCI